VLRVLTKLLQIRRRCKQPVETLHLHDLFPQAVGTKELLLHYVHPRGSRVRFPAGAGNFSLLHRVQTDSGAHPASYPMDTESSSPGVKAAGA
jgi:hypothetical protein